MKPLFLKLQGFTGIVKGLGKDTFEIDLEAIPAEAQLVAFVGPNGSAKTTVLDNLHPYRVMPSRSTTLGPGGFSYWAHLSGTNAAKELRWSHQESLYKSIFSFKRTGKTEKADYYLYVWNVDLRDWTPAQSIDGTKSDGKAGTYDQCIDSVLGIPERFFTSQFAAQRRKSLSSYGASEVKSLLASILNLGQFKLLAGRAAAVAKHLKFRLEALQDDLAVSRHAEQSIIDAQANLLGIDRRRETAMASINGAEAVLGNANASLVVLQAKIDSQAKDTEERNFLRAQIERASRSLAVAKQAARDQSDVEISRELTLAAKAKGEGEEIKLALAKTDDELKRTEIILHHQGAVHKAGEALPAARMRAIELQAKIEDQSSRLAAITPLRKQLMHLQNELGELKSKGEGRSGIIKQLHQTAALIHEVPCQGTPMQSACRLLVQANQAHQQLPVDEAELAKLRVRYQEARQMSAQLAEQVAVGDDLTQQVALLMREQRELQTEITRLSEVAAKADQIEDALRRRPELQVAKKALEARHQAIQDDLESSAERLAAARRKLEADISKLDEETRKEVEEFEVRLTKLDALVSETEISNARERITAASVQLEAARAALTGVDRERVEVVTTVAVLQQTLAKARESVEQANKLAEEISKWKSIEKGMGNDGMVALSIDDAGPEISSLCNRLLSDDYSGRFKVRLDTQRETGTGLLKETFDILVFDSRGGEETPIGLMSGGEQVWVNECLTRAIALHVGQTTAMGYQTLFTDETDGAFDPARKRQFMQMKRSVLKTGGYAREYFISQTPEVWELADHIIYMDRL